MAKNMLKKKQRSAGFSLIEVLIAMLLLVIGVLGAAGMQLYALKYNQTAGVRTQATFLAYSILDSMRANRGDAINNKYNIALGATPATGTDVSSVDLKNWTVSVAQTLPSGEGSVQHTVQAGVDMVTVVLKWDESRVGGNSNINDESATAEEKNDQTFTFVTEL